MFVYLHFVHGEDKFHLCSSHSSPRPKTKEISLEWLVKETIKEMEDINQREEEEEEKESGEVTDISSEEETDLETDEAEEEINFEEIVQRKARRLKRVIREKCEVEYEDEDEETGASPARSKRRPIDKIITELNKKTFAAKIAHQGQSVETRSSHE